jgi:hypothetical protein
MFLEASNHREILVPRSSKMESTALQMAQRQSEIAGLTPVDEDVEPTEDWLVMRL